MRKTEKHQSLYSICAEKQRLSGKKLGQDHNGIYRHALSSCVHKQAGHIKVATKASTDRLMLCLFFK